jgi:hypothetical protein
MNVEIRTKAVQFLFWDYINGIAVQLTNLPKLKLSKSLKTPGVAKTMPMMATTITMNGSHLLSDFIIFMAFLS